MQEAVAQVKRTLGPDAMILQTRAVRSGWLWRLLGRQLVEVTAAAEPTPPAKRGSQPSPAAALSSEPELAAIKRELQQLKDMLARQTVSPAPPLAAPPAGASPMALWLQENGVPEVVARQLGAELAAKAALLGNSPDACRRLLAVWLKQHIAVGGTITVPATGAKVIAFIGPTGVGKTTTIAKLAAMFAMAQRQPVALVTADTYRIAAVAQLQTYADIIGLPLEIVYNGGDLQQAVARHRDKKLILLDTAGRSPNNTAQLAQLRLLLEAVPEAEPYLVLSATTAPADMLNIYEQFNFCQPKIILTKLDEATSCGALVNLAYKHPCTVAYVTTGQNVPDDIAAAEADHLARLALGANHA